MTYKQPHDVADSMDGTIAELLPLLGRPELDVRVRAAEALAGRLGSTAAARVALLRAAGADPDVPRHEPSGLAGPPLTLEPTFRMASEEVPLPMPTPGCIGADIIANGHALRPPPLLVPTEHDERVLRQLSLALCLARPVLLSGPPGAGKTTLLRALAASTPPGGSAGGDRARSASAGGGGISAVAGSVLSSGRSQLDALVTVHLDEQVDSRALLGSYVCGAEPGEFVWQPGVVTQAVAEGRWLLLEDVDRAPLEVMSALAPLLERNVLFVPGRAVSIAAAPGFRLWGTVTTHGRAEVATVERSVFRAAIWQHVSVPPPSDKDLTAIVAARFPPLRAAAGALVTAFTQLQHASGGTAAAATIDAGNAVAIDAGGADTQSTARAEATPDTDTGTGTGAPSLAVAAEKALASARLALSGGRVFSSRELFRWCRRLVAALAPTGAVLPPPDQPGRFSSYFRELLVAEALDTFVAAVRRAGPRAELASLIAAQWQIPTERLRHMLDLRRPEIETTANGVTIGRVNLALEVAGGVEAGRGGGRFALTRHALVTLERVAISVALSEPLLLVGETGTGKTTAVQHLASVLGKTLLVHNLNQQSDSSELVGGFRPVQPRHLFAPLASKFERLFCRSFSRSKNGPFLAKLARRLAKGEWAKLLALVLGACASYAKLRTAAGGEGGAVAGACPGGDGGADGAECSGAGGAGDGIASGAASGGGGVLEHALDAEWEVMGAEAARLRQRLQRRPGGGDGLAFAFVEGSLVQALREGHWLLLDEVNLASPETLERVAGLLEEGGSVALTEKGEASMVPRHPGFRLFAAMNPPTDFGKKELPAGIRSRLTELYVPALTSAEDLALVVLQYLSPVLPSPPVGAVVALYQAATHAAVTRFLDGADQRPEYSLRTLCRALSYVAHALPLGYGLHRAMYDGFHMTFVAQLQARFQPEAEAMLLKHLIPSQPGKLPRPPPPVAPAHPPGPHWIQVGGFWLPTDPRRTCVPDDPTFIVTPAIEARLMHMARMVAARRHPILLQGPTSAGKTSMVERLAKRTGHRLVRINNHEHTDVQEYIGSFAPDAHGRLAFHDGALAQAVRHGYWIVLDELNLAQSEVLEALNRLLDDNRELHIPETGETLSPHPSFMLFATQNPPGAYGGRKVLSRAFRNRFLEMHMDEIPEAELATILERRSALPGSFCRAMVAVMQELQRRRSSSRVFAGRAGFITPRDLFRWADRRPLTYQELAEAGFALLAERLRAPAEREMVAQVLCARLPRVTLEREALYERLLSAAPGGAPPLDSISAAGTVWLPSTRRLYALVAACMAANEPVLLVGETGTGKTTVCQLFAQAIGQTLHIINCHQHTETADFVGGLRPARGRSLALAELTRRVEDAEAAVAAAALALLAGVAMDGDMAEDAASPAPDEMDPVGSLRHRAERAIRSASAASEALGRGASEGRLPVCPVAQSEADLGRALVDLAAVVEELRSSDALFVWVDGPLLTAMRTGQMLLIDEISLAEDSVLERLNSVLDPSREITVPEKGTELEVIRAAPSFRLLATMNPGGDFGKKELSPALRNRFTEVWVPSVTAHAELRTLIGQTLGEGGGSTSGESDVEMRDAEAEWPMAEPMLAFVEWLAQPRSAGGGGAGLSSTTPSLRDLLAWAGFIKATRGELGRAGAFVHGACLTCVDAMGLQVSASRTDREAVRARCVAKLVSLLPTSEQNNAVVCLGSDTVPRFEPGQVPGPTEVTAGGVARRFGLAPFFVPMGSVPPTPAPISLAAPTPRANAFRVLRAMQLRKPVLLEGSPGVGKTSLVQALGAACGQPVVRINLSEQTDLMDLLGSDLPVEGAPPGTYAWQDGAFLAALRAGAWVILDELNLAPQAVLEGLNACLDHRATVFIPELAASFECPPSFRVFGCQNPLQQGGGRKGLPRSFLNRFTQVSACFRPTSAPH
jgi:midasin